jgi:hypothetical protein
LELHFNCKVGKLLASENQKFEFSIKTFITFERWMLANGPQGLALIKSWK